MYGLTNNQGGVHMRVFAYLLAASLAACGGGGGDSGSPSAPPVAPTYSVSGVVTTFAGAGVSGVRVDLSGSASAMATTNAAGGFQFVNVPDGLYVVGPSPAAGSFNPVGISVTVAGQSVTGLAFSLPPPAASMTEIANALATRHASAIAAFNAAETALNNQLAAEGQFRSGRHYTLSRENLIGALSSFTSSALSYLRTVARTATIDREAVASLFNTYATQDAAYASTYYRAAGWGLTGAGLDGFVSDTVTQTNAVYAAAIAQIP